MLSNAKKKKKKVELTALNFNVLPPQPGTEGNIQVFVLCCFLWRLKLTLIDKANKTIAAESVRKRTVYKKSKSAEKHVGKVLGKDAGKLAKGFLKMF